jgi:hypothetical protein
MSDGSEPTVTVASSRSTGCTKNAGLQSDYHVLEPLKEALCKRRYASETGVKEAVRACLRSQTKTFCADEIRRFVQRFNLLAPQFYI